MYNFHFKIYMNMNMQYYVESGYQIFIHCFHFQKEFPAMKIIQVHMADLTLKPQRNRSKAHSPSCQASDDKINTTTSTVNIKLPLAVGWLTLFPQMTNGS